MKLYEPQPATKIYPFDRGWRAVKYVILYFFKRTNATTRWWLNHADTVRAWSSTGVIFKKYCAWVLVIGLWLAGGSQYIAALVLATLFIEAQIIMLTLWAALSLMVIAFLALGTFLYSQYYRLSYRCPACHESMPIPTYFCPVCGEKHSRLWPSIYGILSHKCKCRTKLYTGGARRKQLGSICPNCNHPLNSGVGGGTNIHVAIVGGTFTGKTHYIMMAIREFVYSYAPSHRYRVSFTDPAQKKSFRANFRRLETGHILLKTHEIVPQAYNLKIQARGARVPKLTYIYDAAGEAFDTGENTRQQEYYKWIDAIIFIIDPFAITTFHHTHQADIDSVQDSLRPSKLDVMQAYERLMAMLEARVSVHKGECYIQPIAVVVTKVDTLDLEDEIGASAARRLMERDSSIASEVDAICILVRDFLCTYDLDHCVRDMEKHFANIKYFSCSALGRLPVLGNERGFIPVRVLDPLLWIFSQAKVVKPAQAVDHEA